jgi:hypothetical protein
MHKTMHGLPHAGFNPGFPMSMGIHQFGADATGALLHFIDGDLRATVPPEGFADYAAAHPNCQPIVDRLEYAAKEAARLAAERKAREDAEKEAEIQARVKAQIDAAVQASVSAALAQAQQAQQAAIDAAVKAAVAAQPAAQLMAQPAASLVPAAGAGSPPL